MKKSKSKIQDVISGIHYGVRPEIYQKRVEDYGDETTLRNEYVGRETKKMLRDGLSVDEIRTQLNAPKNLPVIEEATLKNIMDRIGSSKPGKPRKSRKTKVDPEAEVDQDVRDFLNVGSTELANATA